MCVAERKFLNSFFHFDKSDSFADETVKVSTDEEDGPLTRKPQQDVVGGDLGSHSILNQLFAALLPEIEEFIDFGEKQDN